MNVTVETIPEGAVEVFFVNSPGYSGVYVESEDVIGSRPVSYREDDSYMIFKCDVYDLWVLTSTYWKEALIEDNGEGCLGFLSSANGGGDGEEYHWYEYDWGDTEYEFPPDTSRQ